MGLKQKIQQKAFQMYDSNGKVREPTEALVRLSDVLGLVDEHFLKLQKLLDYPKTAPYSRDKLQFAHNYIDVLTKHLEKMKKELLEKELKP